jgi:hypothetical protein
LYPENQTGIARTPQTFALVSRFYPAFPSVRVKTGKQDRKKAEKPGQRYTVCVVGG